MATDSQGRPLSDDGQWAWNGTEWVPASDPGLTPELSGAAADAPSTPSTPDEPDAGATMIAPSPFAGGAPGAGQGAPSGYGSAPASGQASQQPEYGSPAGAGATPGYGSQQQASGSQQEQGYGNAPGYGGTPAAAGYGAAPASFGAPAAPPTSKKPIILAVIGVLVVVAVVLVLVLVVFKGDDKSSSDARPTGNYTCTNDGKKGTITFNDDGTYDLSDNGDSGRFTVTGKALSFDGGDLAGAMGTVGSDAKTVSLSQSGTTLTCKR